MSQRFLYLDGKECDNEINNLLIALLAYKLIDNLINVFTYYVLGITTSIDSIIVVLGLAWFIFRAIPSIIRRQSLISVAVLAFFVLAFLISDTLGVASKYIQEQWTYFFFSVLSYFFVGLSVRNMDDLQRKMKRICPVMIASVFAYYMIILSVTSSEWQNNMVIAYYALPWFGVSIWMYYEDRNLINCILLAISCVLVVALGTRGPMLFVILMFVVGAFRRDKVIKQLIAMLLLIVATLVFVANFNSIVQWIYDFLMTKGIQNYGLYKILYATDISNGRNEINKTVWQAIKEQSILGSGLYSDFALLGGYTHFLPTALMMHFGVFGAFAFVILFFIALKRIICIWKKNDEFWILLILATAGIGKLFFSGTYLQEPLFFLFYGLIIGLKKAEWAVKRHEDTENELYGG